MLRGGCCRSIADDLVFDMIDLAEGVSLGNDMMKALFDHCS